MPRYPSFSQRFACERSNRSRAFTLIELLTVITIIGLLAAIIIPVVGHIRQNAISTKCSNNLRQIGVAMNLYSQENKGFLPAPEDEDERPWFLKISEYLQAETNNTAELTEVYRCPVYSTLPDVEDKGAGAWDSLGYGMSYVMIGSPLTGWPWTGKATEYEARLQQIENPSKTIMVAEDFSWNWGVHASNYSTWKNSADRVERARRHGDSAHYLFVDGRVESLTIEEVEPFLAGYSGP